MTELERNIGYEFKNRSYLEHALNHASLIKKGREFDRYEFVGDRVIGLIISEYLFKRYKNEREGILARMFANLVCTKACAKIARQIGLQDFVNTSTPEMLSNNESVLADSCEALMAAIFLDSDFYTAKEVVLRLWKGLFEVAEISANDPKSKLQEFSQAQYKDVPTYEIVSKRGSDHRPVFEVKVTIRDRNAIGTGQSVKDASADAASKLLQILTNKNNP